VISGVPISSFKSSMRAMGMQPEPFVLEQAEGYVEAPEKSTSSRSTMKEVFEHCARS